VLVAHYPTKGGKLMAIWDDVITESDKEIFRACGYTGTKVNFGNKPALIVIDVTYEFVGDKPEPILKSIERFPLSCGENGWKAVYQIASLLPLARDKQVPVIYSIRDKFIPPSVWQKRNPRTGVGRADKIGNDIVKEVAPTANDIIIHKTAPSVFFGTPLMSVLASFNVDTVLCCGGITSGCVRATVVDAASYGFPVGVIEEGTFDRGEISHKVNLFDMNAKYASVVSVAEVSDYLQKLPGRKTL